MIANICLYAQIGKNMNRLTWKVKGVSLMIQITVVNPGDSLWSIANQYGVPVNDLASLNELDLKPCLFKVKQL